MSYLHVQRLETVIAEYEAVLAAVTCVVRARSQIRVEPEMSRVGFAQLRDAGLNLETTYIIRLFAAFEAILIDYLSAAHPHLRVPRTAEALVNRVALRERIPDPLRETAQRVREYRNPLVHRRIASVPVQSVSQVVAALNRYLARLP